MRNLEESFKKRVPLWFKTTDDSVNMQILSVILPEIELLHNTNQELYDIMNIDNATKAILDIYGKNLGEGRRAQNDVTYRKRIKGKYARQKIKKAHNNVVRTIAEVLGVSLEKIRIDSLANRHLRVEITDSDLTDDQALDLVISSKAHGIIIDEIIITAIENPFRFSPTSEIMYDSDNGFNAGELSSLITEDDLFRFSQNDEITYNTDYGFNIGRWNSTEE